MDPLPKTTDERARDRLKDDVYAYDENYKQTHLWKVTVASNAGPKCVLPIGARRYCQRNARSTYVSAVTQTASINRTGRARRVSAQTPAMSAFRRKKASSPAVNKSMRTARSRDRISAAVGIRIRMAGW